MTSREKRIAALEQHRRSGPGFEAELDRIIEESRPEFEAYAQEHDLNTVEFEHELREQQRRIAEIGIDAYYVEFAAKHGIPVEDMGDAEALRRYNDRMNR